MMKTIMKHETCGKKLKVEVSYANREVWFYSTFCHKCQVKIPGKIVKDVGVRVTFEVPELSQ